MKLTLGKVVEAGAKATAAVAVTQDGTAKELSLHLVRSGGTWRVVRDAAVCAQLVCA